LEWLWVVAFIAIVVAPVIWLARLRRPPRGPDSRAASEAQVGLDQLRMNSRWRP
jgi:hypothetical protein